MSHTSSATSLLDVTPRAVRNQVAARRQRGAVFVEAVIVCAMLMIVFAGAVFFHRMYSAKMQAVRQVRLLAWQAAEEGCPSGFGVGQLFNLIAIDRCTDETCSVGGLDTQTDETPPWLELGAKTGDVTHAVTADRLIGGQTHSMRAHNRVICNERRQNERGDLASIGDYILDAVIQ